MHPPSYDAAPAAATVSPCIFPCVPLASFNAFRHFWLPPASISEIHLAIRRSSFSVYAAKGAAFAALVSLTLCRPRVLSWCCRIDVANSGSLLSASATMNL